MQLIIAVKNSLHSYCTTSFLGPPSWGIEPRALVRLRATHRGIWTLLVEKVPDLLLLLWIVTRAVLNGFLLIYLVAAAGSKHHLEAWPSPTGWHRWWNKACSLPVLMLFLGFCFVLFFCTFYSAAAKRSRSVARRACPSRRYSLHIAPPFLYPLCPAPPALPAVTSSGSSFLGKLNTAATAALASPGLISQKIMSWISSHSHPTVVHSSQIVPFFSLFHF